MNKQQLADHFKERVDMAMKEVNDINNDAIKRSFQNGLAAAFTTAEAMVQGGGM